MCEVNLYIPKFGVVTAPIGKMVLVYKWLLLHLCSYSCRTVPWVTVVHTHTHTHTYIHIHTHTYTGLASYNLHPNCADKWTVIKYIYLLSGW